MSHIDPKLFYDLLNQDAENKPIIIDVREPHEWDYYHLEDSVLIPMNSIPSRIHEMQEEQDIYIICAHGVRSQMVCEYLRKNGYDRVINVDGGMAAVSDLYGFQYD
jgi:rhodanese-related sulfurtransferase